jgi:hypothetical protein
MATSPNYAGTPKINWNAANITAANTAKDGTGTVETVMTAGANGTKVSTISVRARGTNVQTVMRFWLNNGGANTTASNNSHLGEVTLPATTNSETSQLIPTDVVVNRDLPAGYRINVTLGTAVAAGFSVTAYGWDL